jgi:germination protein M
MRSQKKKAGILFAFAVLISLMILGGCGKQKEPGAYHIEYLNSEKSRIVAVDYEPTATDTDGLIQEFLAVLSSDPEDADYRKPIPSNVEVTGYSLEGVLLTLKFDEDYSSMSQVEEVLCRAAVVRTMTQIDGVDCVAFYIGDTPLQDSTGAVIGNMYEESFIENPGEQINSIQNTSLTLYFSDEDGDALIKETRQDVYYSGNVSLEKLVMEQLLEGTDVEGEKSAIPEGTRLVNVSVVDGVCYVSLDETFRNQDYKVNEAIVIYSIVDSLTELPSIGKVQISVNGDTAGVYRDNYSLNSVYERNLDYVTEPGAESTSEEVTEQP